MFVVKRILLYFLLLLSFQLSGERGAQSMSGQTGRPFTVRYLMLETVE
jgi:hypothetical protein